MNKVKSYLPRILLSITLLHGFSCYGLEVNDANAFEHYVLLDNTNELAPDDIFNRAVNLLHTRYDIESINRSYALLQLWLERIKNENNYSLIS